MAIRAGSPSVGRHQLSRYAVIDLRRDVGERQWAPSGGDARCERLIEAELVDRFQSNRPAVREALGELTKMHLVEHIPNKGARVTENSLPELEQIYQMRIELEELAVKWLPLPLLDDQLSKLEEIQAQHSQAVADLDYREIFRLDESFHGTLNANCGNPHLDELIDIMSAILCSLNRLARGLRDSLDSGEYPLFLCAPQLNAIRN